MIQINLLDHSQQKGRQRAMVMPGAGGNAPFGAVILWTVILLVVAVNGSLGWMAWQRVNASSRACAAVRAEYKRVQTEIDAKTKDAERLRKFRDVVNNQMDVLRSLDPPDRILWSQKINMLANLIPPSVFIDEVRINEDVQMVETEASKAAIDAWKKNTKPTKGPQPKQVFRPIIRYHLVLTGLAEGKDNIEQFNNVMAFQRALTNHKTVEANGRVQRFMDGFQTEMQFDVIKGEVYEEVAVNKFVFKLTTVPLGDGKEKARPETRVASAR